MEIRKQIRGLSPEIYLSISVFLTIRMGWTFSFCGGHLLQPQQSGRLFFNWSGFIFLPVLPHSSMWTVWRGCCGYGILAHKKPRTGKGYRPIKWWYMWQSDSAYSRTQEKSGNMVSREWSQIGQTKQVNRCKYHDPPWIRLTLDDTQSRKTLWRKNEPCQQR